VDDPGSPSAGVELARGHSGEELLLARAYGGEWLDRYVDEWRGVRLEISGEDLLGAGIPQGPAIGHGLQAALTAKLDGGAPTREDELRTALEAARE
jgi:tRNA nucleotidyltransferase (CCA-adding enzyme)